jgi:hypothetical protein
MESYRRSRPCHRGEEIYPGISHHSRWAASRRIPSLGLTPRDGPPSVERQ